MHCPGKKTLYKKIKIMLIEAVWDGCSCRQNTLD